MSDSVWKAIVFLSGLLLIYGGGVCVNRAGFDNIFFLIGSGVFAVSLLVLVLAGKPGDKKDKR
jgi:hypothetical protein